MVDYANGGIHGGRASDVQADQNPRLPSSRAIHGSAFPGIAVSARQRTLISLLTLNCHGQRIKSTGVGHQAAKRWFWELLAVGRKHALGMHFIPRTATCVSAVVVDDAFPYVRPPYVSRLPRFCQARFVVVRESLPALSTGVGRCRDAASIASSR